MTIFFMEKFNDIHLLKQKKPFSSWRKHDPVDYSDSLSPCLHTSRVWKVLQQVLSWTNSECEDPTPVNWYSRIVKFQVAYYDL